MDRVEQARTDREEQAAASEQRAPDRGHGERTAEPAAPSSSASAAGPAVQARGAASVDAWQPDVQLMTAMGLSQSRAVQHAPGAPAAAADTATASSVAPAPAPGGGASPLDAAMVRAMGLAGGAAGASAAGGSAAPSLEGITTPPNGKPQGLATPETAKQLDAKKQMAKDAAAAPPAGAPGSEPTR